jgi:hypothetical protein
MVDIIKETLANGEEYQFDLDVCTDAADDVLEELYNMEGTVENFDFTASVFSLFVSSIQILAASGWSATELMEEVAYHSAEQNINTKH